MSLAVVHIVCVCVCVCVSCIFVNSCIYLRAAREISFVLIVLPS